MDEPRGARRARLKPRVLVGGVVDDQLGDDADATPMRFADEAPEVAQRAVVFVNAFV